MIVLRLLAAGLVATASPALARHADSQAADPVTGVWQGTIGTLPAHLCFNRDLSGSYYYDRYRKAISLSLAEGKGWEEQYAEAPKPLFAVDANGDALKGTWIRGSTRLPVVMKRIPMTDIGDEEERGVQGDACGSPEFNGPRLADVAIDRKAAQWNAVPYTKLSLKADAFGESVTVESLELPETSAAVRRVNEVLKRPLVEPPFKSEWFDCLRGSLDRMGEDGEYSRSIEPGMIDRNWLSFRESIGLYCGGMHPDEETRWRTFDLVKGVEVEPADWFLPSAIKVESGSDYVSRQLQEEFRRAIIAGWKAEDPECQDTVVNESYWAIGIAPGAFVFEPKLAHVVAACGETFTVPFAQMDRWLAPEGKAIIATLPR